MEGIYEIGRNFCPETPDRIFAHQIGDGFIVVSEFGADSLDIPASMAIALLRHVTRRQRFAKATIAEGGFAGIEGCYPKTIREARDKDGRIFMGGGLMTTFPVMGTALINAINVAKRSPSGSLLTLDVENDKRLPKEFIRREIPDKNLLAIDWVHSDAASIGEIQSAAKLFRPNPEALKVLFDQYFRSQNLPLSWRKNTNDYLSLTIGD